ncbi:histone-lysine N-methyltransferase ASHR2-like [Arachis hypogaea]|uniref:SET domain-containing protein n=1 Tax=Arachis hypogaea TaxID=3818 RepID=A0A444WVH7_ARAHY|nr:histone-lysine N-methyltransferase ASHR2-like [Arachis hypogaea]XP_025697971.1 histone-lysine N-methyltransferase ASHR2-like [Arachis hypogaea]QHO40095.1 Histone-lysine N-methyltransferase [Arachis hypogaea]RYQ81424.1 hypothetical protein Ahy_Scaffold1g107354 [Arachis hypogaea]
MADSMLRVEHIAGKGRGLVASQALKAGQIILTEPPLILYSSSPLSSSSSYCDHCFRTLLPTTLLSCPSCLNHHFCSNKCLSTSLNSSHSSTICQALLSLQHSPLLQQHHQVQARFVVALHNLAVSEINTLLSLHGTPDDSILQDANFLHDLISPLFPNKKLSVDLVAQALAKDRINSFCLMEPYNPNGPQRSIKAYGIYPKATMFNHDCVPNACRFDYMDTTYTNTNTNDIVIRLIKDVDEGEEICISYFRIGRDYATRKKILMEDYGFVCGCERCKVEASWSNNDEIDDDHDHVPHVRFLKKYVCNIKNCGGTLAPLPPKHDAPFNNNVLECNFCGNFKIDDDDVI